MTENFHEALSRASSTYKEWHSGVHASIFHFSLLIIFGTLFAKDIVFLPNQIKPENKVASVSSAVSLLSEKTTFEEGNSAPAIISFEVSQITGDQVVISWKTDLPASGRVFWGREITKMSDQISLSDFRQDHTVLLDGLSPNTEYFYKIETFLDGPVVDLAIASFRTLSK